ncbi:DUF3899 domain-containing protein [Lactobacillus sp. Sy-1]|uniref:DUF3899 domain-containing protein n=1 Tax=Lactobacillus sp. Sy-1 TaxID=2109645 RepID=UPI001C5751A4|nr:DUF3899 domain-containing protein [Lactobacillus sp. Sy-1]MBW1604801.1 DUF3899 domain-containing protein [Lactobacillus sp. Sy-1]
MLSRLINQFKIMLITTGGAILIALIPLLMHKLSLVVMLSNVYFMVGLFMLVVSAFIMILGGHLFTGWHRVRRRGDNAELPDEQVPARKVGRLKNAPIRVSRSANFCLQISIPLIIVGILITI